MERYITARDRRFQLNTLSACMHVSTHVVHALIPGDALVKVQESILVSTK